MSCHPGICAKKKSPPNLSHCGYSFYITVPILLNNTLLNKARHADLAHLYCGSTIDSRDFTMHEECFHAINRLQKNDDIIITKPDKDSGIVLLNKSDVDKMSEILDDQSKFKRLAPVSSIESRLQKRLLVLVKADLMPK